MKPLRTAILGCGRFARKHVVHLAALEEISLVGFCDALFESADNYNQEFAQGKGRVFTDYEQLFTDLELDLAYICLPPFAHGNEVELACHYGVDLLIEKPIALNTDLALRMKKQVRESGIKCQVGFMYRFGKAALWLKNYLQHRLPDERGFMTARYACNSLHSWWWRDKAKSGGQLVEQVIHIIDLTRFFLGEPIKVYSMQDNLFHRSDGEYTSEDSSATVIRFDSGGIATISATNGAIPNRWDYDWRFFTDNLTADFSDANHAIFHPTTEKDLPETIIAAEEDLYLAETLDLLAAIREDRDPAVPIEEGVLSLKLALAATQAAEQDAPVSLEPPVEIRSSQETK
jgi:UDP-N-acetyl-2-amino-2-deoxyglucuronate dehydrogenase